MRCSPGSDLLDLVLLDFQALLWIPVSTTISLLYKASDYFINLRHRFINRGI